MRIGFSFDYDGDLADSLRAVAALVDEYGQGFLDNPEGYFCSHNDGAVESIEIDPQYSELDALVGDGGAE